MHELSLAENAIELIEMTARREGFTRVHRICIEIGVLSCVEPEALRFALEAAGTGTCAAGAEIDFERVPV
ncbi:MAG: hydrogenase maturation nickel metallochaperone HypA, partial [Pseudomonadota bacterium]